MYKNIFKYVYETPHVIFGLFASVGGVIAWLVGTHFRWIAVLALMPLLWRLAPNRQAAGALVFMHYIVMTRSIPAAYMNFYETSASPIIGMVFWLGSAAFLTIPWVALWHPQHGYAWRLPVLLILLIVPPFGLLGWGHPLLSTAQLLPGTGLVGLGIVTLVLTIATVKPAWGGWVLLALTTIAVSLPAAVATRPNHIIGLSTSLAPIPRNDYLKHYEMTQSLIAEVQRVARPGALIVLPESVAGLWTQTTQTAWSDTAQGLRDQKATVLIGAHKPDASGTDYTPVVVALGHVNAVHAQMIPLPVTVWRPWTTPSAHLHLLASPAQFQIANLTVSVLVCYEQLLLWPAIRHLIKETPDVIVAQSNHAWMRSAELAVIARYQAISSRAIAAMSGSGLVFAINQAANLL